MPQFDVIHYSGQIFWFSLCFITLYFFMSRVILPRVRNILAERKIVINNDLSSAKELEDKRRDLSVKADELMINADLRYIKAIEDANKKAQKFKEVALEEFKNNAEAMVKKSQGEINQMLASLDDKRQKAADGLAQAIKDKVFN